MTFVGNGDDDVVPVPELKLRINADKFGDDYVILPGNNHQHKISPSISSSSSSSSSEDGCLELGDLSEPTTPRVKCAFFCKWVKLFILFAFLGCLAYVFFKWVGPFSMDKGIIPIINWERSTFSTPVLVFLLFITVAIFPTFLLPSSPSMWVAGMTFGYGLGFLLIMSAAVIGVSLPYLIGSLFHHKIQGWLERYPKKASLIRLAGGGEWFDQFKTVALIRISPFPYIVYNYCAVATDVKYGPYILGSILGMIPDVFVAIYTGILIKTLADASDKRHSLSAQEIIFNVLGFAATVATTIICTICAKRRLKTTPIEEEPLLQ